MRCSFKLLAAAVAALIFDTSSVHAQPEGIWQGYDGEWLHVTQQLVAYSRGNSGG